jgi:DNA-binding NarL/FixJ family response regulator
VGALRRLLLVTSNVRRREELGTLLDAAGFLVETPLPGPESDARIGGAPPVAFVIDLSSAQIEIVDVIARAIKQWPKVAIVALTDRRDQARVVAAIRAGAHGCLVHEDANGLIVESIEEAIAGGRPLSRAASAVLVEHVRRSRPPSVERRAVRPLTPRESAVLQHLARGLEYEDVGRLLDVSLNTIRSYVRSIYEKLNVNSRTEAVMSGMKLGLLKGTPFPSNKAR